MRAAIVVHYGVISAQARLDAARRLTSRGAELLLVEELDEALDDRFDLPPST